jgi:hypothetical protein
MAVAEAIRKALDENTPLLVGRIGSTELNYILGGDVGIWGPILEQVSGIWNNYPAFKDKTIEAMEASDLLVSGWYEPLADQEAVFLAQRKIQGTKICLEDLEPWTHPFSALFAGQHLTVISAFADTIAKQYEKRAQIWPSDILPEVAELTTIRTGFSPRIAGSNMRCRWPPHIRSWSDAVQHVVDQVPKTSRIVIIGCGAIGLPIAHELKKRGHIVIVMGGAMQLLFGIKGRRWRNQPVAAHWNDAWTQPAPHEKPAAANLIEAACYW